MFNNSFKDWFAMNESKKKKNIVFNLKPVDDTLFKQISRKHVPHKSGAGSHDSRDKPRKKKGWENEC